VTAYLRERELVTNVYLERRLKVRLEQGGTVEALAFIVDRSHRQYAGSLNVDHAASVVRGAVGQSGRNEDYVFSTVQHLEALGIHDHWLENVAAKLSHD
jgi:cation transport protein ChaC